MKETITVFLWILNFVIYGQINNNYTPGKMISITGAIFKDDSTTLSESTSVTFYSGGTIINGNILMHNDGTYIFNFCSNMLTDSIITIEAIHNYPKYYFGTITVKLTPNQTYNIFVSRVTEKDNQNRPRCGTTEYNNALKQWQEDYNNGQLYRHCDGTIMSYTRLKDEGKMTEEWKRMD